VLEDSIREAFASLSATQTTVPEEYHE